MSHLDVDTMARTVFGESRGEPFIGQVAVASVVLNRSKRPKRFGASVAEVCRKPLQFSCWNADDATYPTVIAANLDQPAFVRAFGIACLVLRGDLNDPTDGADHYHTIAKPAWAKTWPPGWAASMTKTVVLGAHQFYREVA